MTYEKLDSFAHTRRHGPHYYKGRLALLKIEEKETLLIHCPNGPILFRGELCWKIKTFSIPNPEGEEGYHTVMQVQVMTLQAGEEIIKEGEYQMATPCSLFELEPLTEESSVLALLHQIRKQAMGHTADPAGMAAILDLASTALAKAVQEGE